jgi:1,4-alpha-glucan branching enzyme
MVKALHRAGIEVILDVVFNHTAEGDHRDLASILEHDESGHVSGSGRPRALSRSAPAMHHELRS